MTVTLDSDWELQVCKEQGLPLPFHNRGIEAVGSEDSVLTLSTCSRILFCGDAVDGDGAQVLASCSHTR